MRANSISCPGLYLSTILAVALAVAGCTKGSTPSTESTSSSGSVSSGVATLAPTAVDTASVTPTAGGTGSSTHGSGTTLATSSTNDLGATPSEATNSHASQPTGLPSVESSTSAASSASDSNAAVGPSEGTTSEGPGEPEIRFVGRFVRDGSRAAFAWSGSGILAAFEGTEVSIQLDDGGSNQFTVVLDGELRPVLKVQSGSHSYVLAEGLTAGRHEVEVYRRTEASFGTTTFEAFDFGDAGTLVAPSTPKARRLEIVGDSISCGYGNEGADATCSFSADTENHYMTYGAIAARTLDAELSVVAWSGKGIINNYDTDTTNPMPTLYNRVLPDDANSRWDFSVKPHAVIINLGTNDFSTDGDPTTEQFRDGYVGLVDQVRAGAPDAFILCTVGNMLSGGDLDAARAGIHAAVDVLRAAGDENIAAWDMDVPNDDPGCDYHPKVATHTLMADALVTELEKHLGW